MKKNGFMAETLNFAIAKYIKVLSCKELFELAKLKGCTDDFQVQHFRENYVFVKIFPILARMATLSKKDDEDLSLAVYRIMEYSVNAHCRKVVVEPTAIEYLCEARLVLSVVYNFPEIIKHPVMVAEYMQYLVSKHILI